MSKEVSEKKTVDSGSVKARSADGKTEINLKYTITMPDGEVKTEEKEDNGER